MISLGVTWAGPQSWLSQTTFTGVSHSRVVESGNGLCTHLWLNNSTVSWFNLDNLTGEEYIRVVGWNESEIKLIGECLPSNWWVCNHNPISLPTALSTAPDVKVEKLKEALVQERD